MYALPRTSVYILSAFWGVSEKNKKVVQCIKIDNMLEKLGMKTYLLVGLIFLTEGVLTTLFCDGTHIFIECCEFVDLRA